MTAAVIGCSSDDDESKSCPAGTDAGVAVPCECEDGEAGTQVCRADGELGACDCSGDSGGSDSGSGASGSGGSGSGGSDSGSGASGSGGSGSGGTTGGDEDAGTDPGTTTDGGATDPGTTLPTDGDQLSVCEDDTDCDMDFGCYTEGGGQHFCTQLCQENADCEGIQGADYTCSDDGECEVVCEAGNDGNCPDGLTCTMTSGPGPGGPQYRCKYSESAGQSGAEAYAACGTTADCADGLLCLGAFGNIPGYCTHACERVEDCTEQPSSGSIEPSCLQTRPMPGSEMCVLDCSEDENGCPDDMACGFGARCAFE